MNFNEFYNVKLHLKASYQNVTKTTKWTIYKIPNINSKNNNFFSTLMNSQNFVMPSIQYQFCQKIEIKKLTQNASWLITYLLIQRTASPKGA